MGWRVEGNIVQHLTGYFLNSSSESLDVYQRLEVLYSSVSLEMCRTKAICVDRFSTLVT